MYQAFGSFSKNEIDRCRLEAEYRKYNVEGKRNVIGNLAMDGQGEPK